MIATRLKEETKQAHQSLEKVIIQHIKQIKSPEDYLLLLQLFYGYFQPVEKLVDLHLGDMLIPDYHNRRKASSILQDIRYADSSIHPSTSNKLPSINNIPAALGALYVLEGSTLGGVIISRMLKNQAAIADEQLNFFNGYGEKGMAMWQTFVNSINNYEKVNGGGDLLISGAKETFKKFEQWAHEFYTSHVPLTSLSSN